MEIGIPTGFLRLDEAFDRYLATQNLDIHEIGSERADAAYDRFFEAIADGQLEIWFSKNGENYRVPCSEFIGSKEMTLNGQKISKKYPLRLWSTLWLGRYSIGGDEIQALVKLEDLMRHDALYPSKPKRTNARRPREYDHEGCTAHLDEKWEYYGGYGPDEPEWYKPSHLTAEVTKFFDQFERQPSDSWKTKFVQSYLDKKLGRK